MPRGAEATGQLTSPLLSSRSILAFAISAASSGLRRLRRRFRAAFVIRRVCDFDRVTEEARHGFRLTVFPHLRHDSLTRSVGAATECDAASRQPELSTPVILEGAVFAPEGPMHLACS
jgi:hypothetical protein